MGFVVVTRTSPVINVWSSNQHASSPLQYSLVFTEDFLTQLSGQLVSLIS